jgi:hypothetical protein
VPSEFTDSNPPSSLSASTSGQPVTIEATPQREVIRALGQIVRGLSAIFWGLPLALVVCVQSAKGDWFRPLGVLPPLIVTGLLVYGLSLLGGFQKQERIWTTSLERVKIVALINFGISPFLYWWSRVPSSEFFGAAVECLIVSGLAFLLLLNPMLVRLTAMLPDENLRVETRSFATLNRTILTIVLAVLAVYFGLTHLEAGLPARLIVWLLKILPLPHEANMIFYFIDRAGVWLVLFPVLFPVAMTMALLWKIKEVILSSIFDGEQ